MISAFLEALPVALGIVGATLPLVGFALILVSRSDKRAFPCFLAGWYVSAVGLGAVAIAVSDISTPGQQPPAPWLIWLRLCLGAALVGLGIKKLAKQREKNAEVDGPGWMGRVESLTNRSIFLVGAGLAAINPKNAVLFISGSLTIAAKTYNPFEQLVALVFFIGVASLGLVSPLLLKALLGRNADKLFAYFNTVLARHSATIVGLVLLVLGGIVTLNALSEITT